ncbi:hypothetical protein ALC62_06655 [Cyphomyrmex costatus]|uniref:DUF4817 domain-containing protein n=1 Tax=Cyphomyrmex costatus TaxID=456900 RepID=A0A151IIL4_9HYME|nr:hypothetical protein ALC62_06655 [Cyphomyrmex costatus]
MYRYSNNEYADMYLIYGEANCVSMRAERLYAERYPNRVHTDRKTFERLDQRIRWKLNYWAGILGDRVIGPTLLPDILTIRG